MGGNNYPFRRPDDNTPLSYIDVIIIGGNPFQSKVYFGEDEWNGELFWRAAIPA